MVAASNVVRFERKGEALADAGGGQTCGTRIHLSSSTHSLDAAG
jgi:hypothetical protein